MLCEERRVPGQATRRVGADALYAALGAPPDGAALIETRDLEPREVVLRLLVTRNG